MNYRSKHLTAYTFLIGMLLFSVGTNILFYNRIMILQDFIIGSNTWMTVDQFDHIQEEIQRLANEQYQIIPSNKYTK
jgi:hypothetical protein